MEYPKPMSKRLKSASDLTYLDENLKPKIDVGEFELFVGGSCMEGVKGKFSFK
ncbi:hypothetical protein [Flavobacterium sp. WC2509]|uniref:hypothetical protein n=1 Tax=Flavobacterium sp. WC2509 TaxID=3461406 RepID=UPI004043D13A